MGLEIDPLVQRVIALCDPRVDSLSREGLKAHWRAATALAKDVRAVADAATRRV